MLQFDGCVRLASDTEANVWRSFIDKEAGEGAEDRLEEEHGNGADGEEGTNNMESGVVEHNEEAQEEEEEGGEVQERMDEADWSVDMIGRSCWTDTA